MTEGSASDAREPGRLQREAMYMVISKPKRKSAAVGVSHFMMCLLRFSGRRGDCTPRESSMPGRDRRHIRGMWTLDYSFS